MSPVLTQSNWTPPETQAPETPPRQGHTNPPPRHRRGGPGTHLAAKPPPPFPYNIPRVGVVYQSPLPVVGLDSRATAPHCFLRLPPGPGPGTRFPRQQEPPPQGSHQIKKGIPEKVKRERGTLLRRFRPSVVSLWSRAWQGLVGASWGRRSGGIGRPSAARHSEAEFSSLRRERRTAFTVANI